MDGDTTERLSQESQCPEDGFHGLLARASVFAIRRNSTPLSKTLFTLHRNGINICNLETCTGEELTPLFTTLHPLFTRSRLPENLCKSVKSVGHKKEVFSPPTKQGELPIQFRAQSEGEEWWRVVRNSSPLATPVFIGVSANLVKSEE